MIEGFFRAAVGTPEVRVADPDWNRERIAELCREAAEKGAGLLVLVAELVKFSFNDARSPGQEDPKSSGD